MSIAIGVRLRSEVGYHRFWIGLQALNKPNGCRLIIPDPGYSAAIAAQNIIRRFLKDGQETHLFLLDDDAVVSAETLERLYSRHLPVIQGLTWARSLPTFPTIFRGFSGASKEGTASYWVRHDDVQQWFDDPRVEPELNQNQGLSAFVLSCQDPDLIARSDAVGFHAVLIHRDVLEKIGEPYCQGNDLGVHEDFDFSERAIKAGFDLYTDRSVVVGHVLTMPIRPLDYWVYQQVIGSDKETTDREEKKST